MMIPLPVEQSIGDIQKGLESNSCAILKAPPGAGKTTRVPLALLNEPWLENKKILLLEPRRLAAVSCASHMSGLFNESVGQTIGYRIRMDKKTGPNTRIEVITQGIFVRMIQNDPSLEGIGLVIFDEFHERNLQNDLGFALCMDAMGGYCDDLRVLVMSATMETGNVSDVMNQAPVIISEGKSYPVATVYHPVQDRKNQPVPVERAVLNGIRTVLKQTDKDVLVFLPGVGEIRRVLASLDGLDDAIQVLPLYGNLTTKEQARVFAPSKSGYQKIVLTTSIAETSITIDGIGVVIDSGLMRLPRFCAQTGMSRLETLRVSKASADQRRGRAGRTAEGICYRLWSEYDHQLLAPFTQPEILNVDLAGLVLELAAWGVSDMEQLKWLDLPDEKMLDQARSLLIMLGGLDHQGRITHHGEQMVGLGLHPRLAQIVIQGAQKGFARLASLIASLLGERDILHFENSLPDPDVGLRLEVLHTLMLKNRIWEQGFKIKKALARRIIQAALKIEKSIVVAFKDKPTKKNREMAFHVDMAGDLLALGFPDRIAKKRDSAKHTYLMANGKGAYFSQVNSLSNNRYIVAIQLDGDKKNARIFLAAPYSISALNGSFKDELKTLQVQEWNKKQTCVQAKEQIFYKKILVQEKRLSEIDPYKACDILLEQIRQSGIDILPWTKKLLSFKERAVFLKQTGRFNQLPDLSDEHLESTLDQWLKPFVQGCNSFKQLKRMDLEGAVFSLFNWEEKQIVKSNAPTHIVVPSGSKKPLKYTGQNILLESPVLEVRLQEMFSLPQTPKIAGNTIAVTLHLLSPAGRPVQITNDLNSFWENTYAQVKKDLMGRYPKHYWPDDPMTAIPTSRVRPQKR